MAKEKKDFSAAEVAQKIKDAGHPTDQKLSTLLNVSTRTIFRMRHNGATAKQMQELTECLQKIKDGTINLDDPHIYEQWRCIPLTTEDLLFLLEMSKVKGLEKPLTLGIIVELLKFLQSPKQQ